MNGHRIADLAAQFNLELRGNPETIIVGVCNLAPGKAGHLSYLGHKKFAEQLETTLSSATVVAPGFAERATHDVLIAKDPNLAFARIARLFDPDRIFTAGVSASASVADTAVLGAGVHIGPGTVVEEGAQIGAGTFVGSNCVIGRDAVLGGACRLLAQVCIAPRVRIGDRCQIQSGAVIGSRGFGNVMGPNGWEEIPQLGSVVVGDDVEIGANTCIDRGTIEDTVIGRGVRLDNLIQIAHNCVIGEHTAIAACVGIAGSTRIGARCMIGGQAGFAGHLNIADDVIVLGDAMVTKSLLEKGVYGSGIPVESVRDWRRMVSRVRRLKSTESRLKTVEKHLGIKGGDEDDGEY